MNPALFEKHNHTNKHPSPWSNLSNAGDALDCLAQNAMEQLDDLAEDVSFMRDTGRPDLAEKIRRKANGIFMSDTTGQTNREWSLLPMNLPRVKRVPDGYHDLPIFLQEFIFACAETDATKTIAIFKEYGYFNIWILIDPHSGRKVRDFCDLYAQSSINWGSVKSDFRVMAVQPFDEMGLPEDSIILEF